MKDWGFAQTDTSQELAQIHYFSIQKRYPTGQVEFVITVKEFVTPKEPTMIFFAQADKQTNQRTAPYTPSGWGNNLMTALRTCIEEIHRFPYEEEARASGV